MTLPMFDPNEIYQLHKEATPAPWEVVDGVHINSPDGEVAVASNETDARYIATTRNSTPTLLGGMYALQRERDHYRDDRDRAQESVAFLQHQVARTADERWQIAEWIESIASETDESDALDGIVAHLRNNTWLADKVRLMEKHDRAAP